MNNPNPKSTNLVSNDRLPAAPQAPVSFTNEETHVKQGPGSEVWEAYRPTIKRLYLDEDKTLKDVMAIMQREYGHKATVKMYKYRINKWGLDKNCKANEMKAIARKKVERDAIGKASSFQIRGWPIEVEEVLRYFKRKSYYSLEELVMREKFPRPKTPSSIEVSTPGASDASPNSDNAHSIDSASTIVDYPSSDLVRRQLLRRNENLRRLSFSSRISPSPEPPRELLIPERLFSAIKMLLQSCGDREIWTTDEDGSLVPRQTGRRVGSHQYAIFDFLDHCWSAAAFLENKLFVEARQLLYKACEKSTDVVEEGHPRTTNSILFIYLHFHQIGYADAAIQVFKHIRSTTIMTPSSTDAFGHFIKNLLLLDQNVEEVCFTAWKCNVDIFEQHLEPFHDTWLMSRLYYIEAMSSRNSWQEAENLLWVLLSQLEQFCGRFDSRCCRILTGLAWSLYRQNMFQEAERIGHDAFQRAKHLESRVWQLKALDIILEAQYRQHKDDQAKENLGRCIDMSTEMYGEQDPETIRNLLKLEKWLVFWNKREEASTVAARRARLLGPPEIQELM